MWQVYFINNQSSNTFLQHIQGPNIQIQTLQMSLNRLGQRLKDHFTLFLTKSANPPPLLFFTLYIYWHLGIQFPNYVAYTFFTVGVLFSLLFSYNHFYIYSPVLNNGIGYLSILNLGLGLLAANEKWKMYLFLFIIGDSLTIEYNEVKSVYRICCCMYFCVDIYKNLIFGSIRDNMMFFSGFGTILVFEVLCKVIESVKGYDGIGYFTVPFALLMCYKLIDSRIKELRKEDVSALRNVQLMLHFIALIQEDLSSAYSREGFLQTHRQSCRDLQCFCHNSSIRYQSDPNQSINKTTFSSLLQYYFIRSMYQKALGVKSIPKKQLLYNKFIQFLIQNNQVIYAIQMYSKLQLLEAKFYYFRWVERQRLYYSIRQKIKQLEYFNPFNKQFTYVFKYDNSYLYLASEIKDILKIKVNFWKEVGKESPQMITLQNSGRQIVDRMYDLNNFYYKEIKSQEEKINNFNGTIVYAMYLLSTTNYKEYAESLIKNTSRTLESIKIHEDNISETYGLKILIRDSKKSCNQKIQSLTSIIEPNQLDKLISEGSYVLIEEKEERERRKKIVKFYEDGFVQIITNCSGSLCKLLKSSKNQLIGKDLNTVIPNSYQQRHHNKVGKILHYDSHVNKQIVNLSFINKIREVPLKTADNKLINARLCVKLFQDIQEGVSFVALVQTINQNKVTLITDLQGNLQQYEEGLSSLKILQHEQVKREIMQIKEEWQAQYVITTKKINLSFIDNNYSITFSSPYQSSFLPHNTEAKRNSIEELPQSQDEEKKLFMKKSMEQRIQLPPPIHIDITNESIPYLSNLRQDREQQMTKCIKKMQSVFYKTDTESQSSTNSSRKSGVVNVLTSFSQNYFIPFYGYIMGLFGLVLITSIIVNIIGFTLLGLGWDNSNKIKNPIINIISIMNIRSMMIDTVSHQADFKQYNENPLINQSNVNNFYGLDKTTYPIYVQQLMARTKLYYKESVNSVSMYLSDLLVSKFQSAQTLSIPTTNPANPDKTKATQNLPLQNVFMNYLVDLDLLSRGKPYDKTIISLNFWSIVEYILSRVSAVDSVIIEAINNAVMVNIIYCVGVSVVLLLAIVPLYFLLKKRIKRHIDIYDLIVSVQGEQIKKQIKKLESIIQIINHSNQSSQILKTYTINYLARKRSSAMSGDIGNNQMMQGLIETRNESIFQQKQGASVNAQQQLQLKTNTNREPFINKNQALSRLIGEQIVGEQFARLQLRKRSGQLDLKGSEGDFKHVVVKHWILYVFIIMSTFTLVIIAISKATYYSQVKSTLSTLTTVYSSFIQQALLLMNAKLFFRGMSITNFTYHNDTFDSWLPKRIYQNNALKFNTPFNQQLLQPTCKTPNDIPYMFCQQEYSLLTLRQQLSHFIKQSYEKRIKFNTEYNLTTANWTLSPASQLEPFSQYFFYIQSMRDKISNFSRQYKNQVLQQMLDGQQQLDYKLKVIFIAGLSWSVVCLIIGLFLMNYMKKQYFREIIIISFLNNEMISKNKRVQSFLQMLSKSSY